MAQSEEDSDRGSRWQFLTTEAVAGKLRATAERDSIRLADVILNVIDDHAGSLDAIVNARLERDTIEGPLFGRRYRPAPEPKTSIMIRGLTQRQRSILTREARKRGVSTPFLVTAALDHSLTS